MKAFVNYIKALYAAEPVIINAAVTYGVIALVATTGIVASPLSIGVLVASGLAILVNGTVSRSQVTPSE